MCFLRTQFSCSHISFLILRDSCLSNQVSPSATVMTTGNVMGLLVASVKDIATETICFLTLSATVYIMPFRQTHTIYLEVSIKCCVLFCFINSGDLFFLLAAGLQCRAVPANKRWFGEKLKDMIKGKKLISLSITPFLLLF